VFSWFLRRMKELGKTDEGGFTLIELLAVVLMLLAVPLLPQFF
jgi:prepilin-type N-terminal cleavage/methylation domain-containing protein